MPVRGSFLRLFATHPPLVESHPGDEPDFDGLFLRIVPDSEEGPPRAKRCPPCGAGRAGVRDAERPTTTGTLGPGRRHFRGMSQPLVDAAREPFFAPAVIYALLLSRDDEATCGIGNCNFSKSNWNRR